jgi:ElaB/YqjD/DUF883 family membrane-anchored ribosome-binding protein
MLYYAPQELPMTDDNKNSEQILEAARTELDAGLDDAVAFLKRQWRDNPIGVVAAAAGLGLLVGLLLGRRR